MQHACMVTTTVVHVFSGADAGINDKRKGGWGWGGGGGGGGWGWLISYPDRSFHSYGWITSPLREKWVW